MKRLFVMLLAALLILSGCSASGSGKSTSPEASSAGASASVEAEATEAPAEAEATEAAADAAGAENHVPTLDEAQVRFVYAEDDYVMIAYYGPQENISTTFCRADGTSFSKAPTPYNCQLGNGWRLINTKELPDGVDAGSLALRVTDYNAGSASRVFSDFGEAMTDDELREIGVTFFEGHACCPTDAEQVLYDSDEFGIQVFFRWIAGDRKITAETWPFTLDAFAFYAGDGTPLAEKFGGYTFEVRARYDDMYAVFQSKDSTSEENEKNCDALAALKPYMVYTAKDGTTQRFDLLVNYK